MPRFDTRFQAHRRDVLHRLSNLDPDDIVSELNVDTDLLMDVLWFKIEEYVELTYEDTHYDDKDEDEAQGFQIEDEDFLG